WRRVFWRIKVSSRDRCVQDCACGARGTFALAQVCPPRHTMAHATSATIWRDPNFAEPLSAPIAESSRFAKEISVESYVVVTCLFGPAGLANNGCLVNRHCHSE